MTPLPVTVEFDQFMPPVTMYKPGLNVTVAPLRFKPLSKYQALSVVLTPDTVQDPTVVVVQLEKLGAVT